MTTNGSVTATDVRGMLDAGVAQAEIRRQLLETGAWSEAGAAEIVNFMVRGPDPLMLASITLPGHRRRARQTTNRASVPDAS